MRVLKSQFITKSHYRAGPVPGHANLTGGCLNYLAECALRLEKASSLPGRDVPYSFGGVAKGSLWSWIEKVPLQPGGTSPNWGTFVPACTFNKP